MNYDSRGIEIAHKNHLFCLSTNLRDTSGDGVEGDAFVTADFTSVSSCAIRNSRGYIMLAI